MYKKFIMLFGFLLFLSVFVGSVYAVPQFNENSTSRAGGSQYWQSANWGFQMNITNNTADFENITASGVKFELGRPDGSRTNYTNASSGITTFTNLTDGVFYVNFTQVQLGGGGSYNYTWYANDTDDIWNVSEVNNFTVIANTSTSSYMNMTLGNETASSHAEANFSAIYYSSHNATGWYSSSIFGTQSITFTLTRNGTNVGTSNPQTDKTILAVKTSGSGLMYNFTYWTAGNANYSATSKKYYMNITANTSTDIIFVLVDGVNSNTTYDPTGPRTTNVTGYLWDRTQAITCNLFRSGNELYSESDYTNVTSTSTDGDPGSDIQNLDYGTYNYIYNCTANANYTSTSITLNRMIALNPYSPSGGGGGGGGGIAPAVAPPPVAPVSQPSIFPLTTVGGQPVAISLEQKFFGIALKWWIVIAIVGFIIFRKKR